MLIAAERTSTQPGPKGQSRQARVSTVAYQRISHSSFTFSLFFRLSHRRKTTFWTSMVFLSDLKISRSMTAD